jgi:signal transduction histidine kinase
MSKMIDEVLLLGKVEGGQMRFAPAPLDLRELCVRLVDEMHSATQRRCPIEFRAPEESVPASGDEALLRHILGNLLSNAVKYSPAGEPVRLEVARDGAHAVLIVTDRGVGIPAADQPKIFQAFQRASNVGQIAGTGLGLVIVQRCVDLHGGKIDLQSEVGQGTRVTVRLPLFQKPRGKAKVRAQK